MFGKCILLLFVTIAIACAKPNYVNKEDNRPPPQQALKADCSLQFKSSGRCLQILWQDSIVVGKPATAVVKVFRPSRFDGSPIPISFPLSDSETLSMVLWMPSMNHGSAPTKLSLPEIDTGTYLFTDIVFIMSGPWEIKIKYTKNNQAIDEAVVNIDVL